MLLAIHGSLTSGLASDDARKYLCCYILKQIGVTDIHTHTYSAMKLPHHNQTHYSLKFSSSPLITHSKSTFIPPVSWQAFSLGMTFTNLRKCNPYILVFVLDVCGCAECISRRQRIVYVTKDLGTIIAGFISVTKGDQTNRSVTQSLSIVYSSYVCS